MPKTSPKKSPIPKNPTLPTRRAIIKKALPVKTTNRPIRITVSTHGGMIRRFKNVGFYIPPNMRVAVYTPPYCSLLDENINLTLNNAHKIYEPGTRMPEMNLMLMHTKNNEERFAVAERKGFYHYITANGQPLRTEHFSELKRYKTYEFHKNPNKIAYRYVTTSQFLSMLLNRYGEERKIIVKIIACRSDSNNEFQVSYLPKKKEKRLNRKYWNNNENYENNNWDQVQQTRLIERMKRSGNRENLSFANNVETQLQKYGTRRNIILKYLQKRFKKEEDVEEEYELWKNALGKRRPN
mgnify:CR=1 FL=1|tara:strand:- start:2350 stop:3237 length:888 start_codon:yes stop_codon:yes gene_type:complete